MPWRLIQVPALGQGTVQHYQLQSQGAHYLVLNEQNDLSIVSEERAAETQHALACITITSWGVKMEALEDSVGIKPSQPRPSSPGNGYALKKRTPGHSEAIFIRENDLLILPKLPFRLTLGYSPSEVQVNSSVTAAAEIPESEDHEVRGETPEQQEQEAAAEPETEDEDLDATITAVAATQSHPKSLRATPDLSNSRTEVIQETPAANRVQLLTEMSTTSNLVETQNSTRDRAQGEDVTMTGQEHYSTATIKQTQMGKEAHANINVKSPKPKSELLADAPVDSTASAVNYRPPQGSDKGTGNEEFQTLSESRRGTRKHPTIQIPRPKAGVKRPSPAPEPEVGTKSRSSHPTKRVKKEDETGQDSDLSNINVQKPAFKATPAKRKGATASDVKTPASKTTPRSRSSSVDSELLYTGPKPVVAFSNSGLPQLPTLMRFLQRQGGTKVESVREGECNILCIKDGPLKKSMKLLLCIALGIPIVTDAWLHESARKARFLSLESYIPKVPEQEQDWAFSMSHIWGNPHPNLLKNYTVYFTPSLKGLFKPFTEVDEVCKAVGARRIISKPGKEVKDVKGMILLGLDDKDSDCDLLLASGHQVYSRDLLTIGIMRGSIDLDSEEFKIKPVGSQKKEKEAKKKGRPRKS